MYVQTIWGQMDYLDWSNVSTRMDFAEFVNAQNVEVKLKYVSLPNLCEEKTNTWSIWKSQTWMRQKIRKRAKELFNIANSMT